MSQPFERHTIAFVVRLWVEPMPREGEPRWRGQIEHVESEEKTYFQVPAALLKFLATHLSSSSTKASTMSFRTEVQEPES